jgi:hypothetical protein
MVHTFLADLFGRDLWQDRRVDVALRVIDSRASPTHFYTRYFFLTKGQPTLWVLLH